MSAPPLDEAEFRRWRHEADRALAGARVQEREALYNWACFAAEQAAQLAVKGLLHGLGRAPWGHDLDRLATMVADAGAAVPEPVRDSVHRLVRHYIPARYPDAHPGGGPGEHYGASDSAQAIDDAEAVLAFVDGAWGEASGESG
jgi:HEPN domain-containing protein